MEFPDKDFPQVVWGVALRNKEIAEAAIKFCNKSYAYPVFKEIYGQTTIQVVARKGIDLSIILQTIKTYVLILGD